MEHGTRLMILQRAVGIDWEKSSRGSPSESFALGTQGTNETISCGGLVAGSRHIKVSRHETQH